jgi:Cu/Ag efflux pump CusA
MLASALAALVGIFLLLQAAFGSWRLAALFTLTLPVSLSGGVLAAFLFRTDMTLPTLAGFIPVLAVAVRGGIAVLARAGALQAQDGRRTRTTAVVEAAGERLGPLLTTAVATMVALVPLIVTGTVPGQEIAQPIAIVVFGGLITTTLVTAFVVPALYAVLGRGGEAGEHDEPEEPEKFELATT